MTSAAYIGMGLIGSRRRAIAEELGLETSFVVEPSVEIRSRIAGATFPVFASLEEPDALDAELCRTDVTFIAVPHDQATEACLWAFSRGSHVLCEKPMGLTSRQATAIAAAAVDAKRVFSAGFNYRYLAGVTRLRELLQDGHVGDPIAVRMFMGHGGRPHMEEEWKLALKHSGGGVLIDPGIHLVDLASHLFGPAEVIAARLARSFWNADVEDVCSLALRCGGIGVNIDVNLVSWKNLFSIEVFGSEGTVLLSGRGGNYGAQSVEYVNRWFWNGSDRREQWSLGDVDCSFHLEVEAFLQLIGDQQGDVVLSGAGDGIRALQIVEDAYELARIDKLGSGSNI
jgi:1,5-anhydro-D-fructose reductase (1,5-anhydro-D-mannitol-forming)